MEKHASHLPTLLAYQLGHSWPRQQFHNRGLVHASVTHQGAVASGIMQISPIDTPSIRCRRFRKHKSCLPRGGRWNLRPDTTTMHQQRISSSNTMKNYINTPDQKENDKSPETNPELTEIYNLNDREFKIFVIKRLNELQVNSEIQFNECRNKINE